MSKQWHGGWWQQGELLLQATEQAGESITLADLMEDKDPDVIILTTEDTLGGLFDTPSDGEKWKAESLADWVRKKNKSDRWHVYTKADGEDLKLIREYHSKINILAAYIKQERTYRGDWVLDIGSKVILNKMRRWVYENDD